MEDPAMSDEIYTSGRWVTKPGREAEFVRLWREFAEWSKANAEGAGWVVLLQDREQPNAFLSVGPWDSEQAIAAWRESEGFRSRIGAIRDLLETFEPSALTPVVAMGLRELNQD
jgi:heme-degrading monooxygenase HmoA